MPRIYIDYSDGNYSWRPTEKDGHAVVEVPGWRIWWLRAISWLDRRANRYLLRLDNAWREEKENR